MQNVLHAKISEQFMSVYAPWLMCVHVEKLYLLYEDTFMQPYLIHTVCSFNAYLPNGLFSEKPKPHAVWGPTIYNTFIYSLPYISALMLHKKLSSLYENPIFLNSLTVFLTRNYFPHIEYILNDNNGESQSQQFNSCTSFVLFS